MRFRLQLERSPRQSSSPLVRPVSAFTSIYSRLVKLSSHTRWCASSTIVRSHVTFSRSSTSAG